MRVFFAALSTLALLALPVLARQPQLLPEQPQPQVSERTQALLRFDHEYSRALQANYTAAARLSIASAAPNLTMPTGYNASVADKLFLLSATAYCTDDANLRGWTCNSCEMFGNFTVTAIMDNTHNQGFVGYFTQGLPASPVPGTPVGADEPFVVVAFRGTMPNDIGDWLEDLSYGSSTPFSTQYPDVQVHDGFKAAYTSMKSKMLPGLATAFSVSGARTMLLVGHSLGAAMAEVAALDLKLNYYTTKYYATYTQGCPRLGNQAFADLYDKVIHASFREVHQADLVPHLPLLSMGFVHGPTEVWYNEAWNSSRICSGSNGEDLTCSDSLSMPISVQDHIMYRGVHVGGLCTDKAKVSGIKPRESPAPKFVQSQQQQQHAARPRKSHQRVVLKEQ